MNLTRLQVDWPLNLRISRQDRWLHTSSRVCSGELALRFFAVNVGCLLINTKLIGNRSVAVNLVGVINV